MSLRPVHLIFPAAMLLLSAGQTEFLVNLPSEELFVNESVLNITVSGQLNSLFKDRGADPQYHPVTVSYREPDSALVTLSVKAKTRGHFRRDEGNCSLPPILLNFGKGDSTARSVFSGQNKMKLVTPCRDDKYVVREYMVYRIYNLFTPKSFRARLVRVTFDDTGKGKKSEPVFGILLEEEDQMAARNQSTSIEGKLVRPEHTLREDFIRMAVFEYFIANTDWSVQYMQNVKLLSTPSGLPATVPYDFDHAGIVDAPYAKPREELMMAGIRDRRYRGFCLNNMALFEPTFAQFNAQKDKIMSLYNDSPYLEASYKKSTTRFIEQFYKTINDPKLAKSAFEYPCQPGNTGNIVIQPLETK